MDDLNYEHQLCQAFLAEPDINSLLGNYFNNSKSFYKYIELCLLMGYDQVVNENYILEHI
jgi:hypothetical protein